MSLDMDKEQLKGLINFAKNEVLDEERANAQMMENLSVLFNNDQNLHRVMMMSLTHAGQVNMTPPVGAFPTHKPQQDMSLVFNATDDFTNKVMDKLSRYATYYSCFANAGTEFPVKVVEQARQLLMIGTKPALFNELDLRFANIAILMELLDREQVNYGEGFFTLVGEKAMNGNQSYNKATLKFFHPTYTGSVYQIEKSVYQYNFQYTHLSNTTTGNISFNNGDGSQVIYIPDGLLVFLDMAIRALYKEYSDAFLNAMPSDIAEVYDAAKIRHMSPKLMIADRVENIGVSLNEIVKACMSKFKDEDNLTYPEKMQAVRSYIRSRLEYARDLSIQGHRVAQISQYDVNVSDDNELIIFSTLVHTFGVAAEVKEDSQIGRQTYEKKKLQFEFNHLGVSNVDEELENEDDNVLLFNLWVVNAFEKDFRSILHSAQQIEVLRKFGSTY